jgi:hypothetical protein
MFTPDMIDALRKLSYKCVEKMHEEPVPEPVPQECPVCNGEGWRLVTRPDGSTYIQNCTMCVGTGSNPALWTEEEIADWQHEYDLYTR